MSIGSPLTVSAFSFTPAIGVAGAPQLSVMFRPTEAVIVHLSVVKDDEEIERGSKRIGGGIAAAFLHVVFEIERDVTEVDAFNLAMECGERRLDCPRNLLRRRVRRGT